MSGDEAPAATILAASEIVAPASPTAVARLDVGHETAARPRGNSCPHVEAEPVAATEQQPAAIIPEPNPPATIGDVEKPLEALDYAVDRVCAVAVPEAPSTSRSEQAEPRRLSITLAHISLIPKLQHAFASSSDPPLDPAPLSPFLTPDGSEDDEPPGAGGTTPPRTAVGGGSRTQRRHTRASPTATACSEIPLSGRASRLVRDASAKNAVVAAVRALNEEAVLADARDAEVSSAKAAAILEEGGDVATPLLPFPLAHHSTETESLPEGVAMVSADSSQSHPQHEERQATRGAELFRADSHPVAVTDVRVHCDYLHAGPIGPPDASSPTASSASGASLARSTQKHPWGTPPVQPSTTTTTIPPISGRGGGGAASGRPARRPRGSSEAIQMSGRGDGGGGGNRHGQHHRSSGGGSHSRGSLSSAMLAVSMARRPDTPERHRLPVPVAVAVGGAAAAVSHSERGLGDGGAVGGPHAGNSRGEM